MVRLVWFCIVVVSSKRFWAVSKGSGQSKKVLAGSCGSWLAVNGQGVWFQKVLVGSKRFCDVLKRFQHVLKGFWQVLVGSGGFWMVRLVWFCIVVVSSKRF